MIYKIEERRFKLVILALSLVLFAVLGFIFISFGNETGLKVDTFSDRLLQKLLASSVPLDIPLEGSLLYDGEPLPYDEGSGTYFIPVDLKNSAWESGRITAANGLKAVFAENPSLYDKEEAVGEDISFPFYLISPSGYRQCGVKFTGLPVMDITQTGDQVSETERVFSMKLYEAAKKGPVVTSSLISGRLRGNTSLTYEKKSLRIKLLEEKEDRYVGKKKALLGMRKDDDWILNSLYADNTRLRDKLCMDLWKETGACDNPFGLELGVEGEYTEVLIDHGYAGLYLLTYPVDRKITKTARVSDQLSAGRTVVERIYKKKYSAPLKAEYFTGPLQDENMPFYRGGYVLKGDTVLADETEWEPLYELGKLCDSDDETFLAGIRSVTDEQNLMACWLFYQAIAGYDNENKNHYIVTKEQSGRPVCYFVPWDMNISFGCVYTDNEFYCKQSDEAIGDEVLFEPASRLFDLDPDAQAYARTLWRSWRTDAFDTQKLQKRMDELENLLVSSGAMKREMSRWPGGNASADTSYMKDFTAKRLKWVDVLVE